MLGSALLFPEAEVGEDAQPGRRGASGSDQYSPWGNGMLSEKGRLSASCMPAALSGQGRELLEMGWLGLLGMCAPFFKGDLQMAQKSLVFQFFSPAHVYPRQNNIPVCLQGLSLS